MELREAKGVEWKEQKKKTHQVDGFVAYGVHAVGLHCGIGIGFDGLEVGGGEYKDSGGGWRRSRGVWRAQLRHWPSGLAPSRWIWLCCLPPSLPPSRSRRRRRSIPWSRRLPLSPWIARLCYYTVCMLDDVWRGGVDWIGEKRRDVRTERSGAEWTVPSPSAFPSLPTTRHDTTVAKGQRASREEDDHGTGRQGGQVNKPSS